MKVHRTYDLKRIYIYMITTVGLAGPCRAESISSADWWRFCASTSRLSSSSVSSWALVTSQLWEFLQFLSVCFFWDLVKSSAKIYAWLATNPLIYIENNSTARRMIFHKTATKWVSTKQSPSNESRQNSLPPKWVSTKQSSNQWV